MNVLIVTEPDDIHAVLVKMALEAKAVSCTLLFSSDMPAKQKHSIAITNQDFLWCAVESDTGNYLDYQMEFDSIWWRRPGRPWVPDSVHEQDISFARQENYLYHDSLPFMLHHKAWWVNPVESHRKSRSPIIQLQYARECGFKVPNTLVSNAPEEIKRFIKLNEKVVYKSFYPHLWSESEGIKVLQSKTIALDELPSDQILQLVPGIYQAYREKKYALRVTCFGSLISAVQIENDQKSVLKATLSAAISARIVQFMQKMGIVFGCFDFIVTQDDELLFIEFNEQGQFLWIEEHCPELCYLDMFAEFLIRKSFEFSWVKSSQFISALEIDKEALIVLEGNMQRHSIQGY